jgi:carbonic anhydrase
MRTAEEALEELRRGNARFVAGERCDDGAIAQVKRGELVAGQEPFAVVLGCSDSRVPVELVFDQGLGDLFVIRVAGNICAPSHLASIEFAEEHFGTPLVVVLGHSSCGAVKATVDALDSPSSTPPGSLPSIVDRIRPAVEATATRALRDDPEELVRLCVRENVRATVRTLIAGSAIVSERVERGDLLVVGAEYSLETGEVDFFEGVLS